MHIDAVNGRSLLIRGLLVGESVACRILQYTWRWSLIERSVATQGPLLQFQPACHNAAFT